MGCGGFKFLEHTADVYFVSSGYSLEEAFVNAAKALFETITDTSKVDIDLCIEVSDSCHDLPNCVYRWLEDLLILHDSRNLLFSGFEFRLSEQSEGRYMFSAKACGEAFNPNKHEPRVVVKAVTYSLMSIENVDNCWSIYAVLDV
ncbi:MAG: archease [Sulfolobales archaeon]|nr:archease [Sulfolobales archaeon]MCX8186312.1 archease [Sulfolobales archaeon]MDW7968952.1 archease [Sulfolobales archaeon]